MKKFNRKKIAFLLACASILSSKARARNENEPQSPQTVAAVGGAATKNSNKGLINWVKNHKWQLGVGSTLTVVAVVLYTILGKYSKPKKEKPKKEELKEKESKTEEPKTEELKTEELKNKVDLKKEGSEQKKTPKEKELKNLKKEEPKKEDSQEVDAVEYILREAEKRKDELINNCNNEDNDVEKIFEILKKYLNGAKKGYYIFKELIKDFDGTSKIQSKNIYVDFCRNCFLAILDFDNYSFYIKIYNSSYQYSSFQVKTIKIDRYKREELLKMGRKNEMPEDREGDMEVVTL